MTALPLLLVLTAGAGDARTPARTAGDARDAASAPAAQTARTAGAAPAGAPAPAPLAGATAPATASAPATATSQAADAAAQGASAEDDIAPGDARAQARIDEDESRATARRAEIDGLRAQLSTLEAEVSDLRARTSLARQDAAEARADAAAGRTAVAAQADAARSVERRAAVSGEALRQLDVALRALTQGDASGVDASLATQADALETARLEAGWRKSPEEALQAAQGASFIGAARAALARGDLHEARLALGRASAATAGARALAQEGAVAPGVAAQPPAAGEDARAAYPGR